MQLSFYSKSNTNKHMQSNTHTHLINTFLYFLTTISLPKNEISILDSINLV